MTALAWIYIGAFAVLLLPDGKRLDLRKDVNWRSPRPYVRLTMTTVGLALAVWTVAA